MYSNKSEDIVRVIREILNNENELQDNKKSAEDILEKQKLPPIPQKAHDLLMKISKSSQTWNNVFNAVEDLRKNFRNAGSLDSTADQAQIGMASVLLILFGLEILSMDINV